MSDVYAGDEDLAADGGPTGRGAGRNSAYVYQVSADADPDAFFRIVGQLLFCNRSPYRVELDSATAESLNIRAELRGIDSGVADSIRRKLQRLTCVTSVAMHADLIAAPEVVPETPPTSA